MIAKARRQLRFAIAGWIAGALGALGLGLVWPNVFPAILRTDGLYGTIPGLLVILGAVVLLASPAALVGGVIGGRIPQEGGRTEQMIMAAVVGVTLALPCGCLGLWFFTGW